MQIRTALRRLRHLPVRSDRDGSDFSDHMTELAKSIGMPSTLASGPMPVKQFHPLTIQGLYAFWYDAKRDMAFVVYAVDKNLEALARLFEISLGSLPLDRRRRLS